MVKLSKTERLILSNQYKLLKVMEDTDEYDEFIEILENGYEIFYDEIFMNIFDELPASCGQFVLDILCFYEAVEFYKRDNPHDDEIINHPYSCFKGFDGNNETKYMTFAGFLVFSQHRFEILKKYANTTNQFNSHMPMLDTYQKMVNLWDSKYNKKYGLERDEILDVLNAP